MGQGGDTLKRGNTKRTGTKHVFVLIVLVLLVTAMAPAMNAGTSSSATLPDSVPVEMGRTGVYPSDEMLSDTSPEVPSWTSGGRVFIIVQEDLYSAMPQSIRKLADDIGTRRHAVYDVKILHDDWTDPAQVRSALSLGYGQAGSLSGAILVGDIPAAWYRMLNPEDWGGDFWETFPIDLYYMDLDGAWDGGTGDGLASPFTTHTAGNGGDLGPEIWVGRIYTESLPGIGTEAALIDNYINKVNEYSWGNTTRQDRALVYVDDPWYNLSISSNNAVGLAYANRTLVNDPSLTIKSDYMSRMAQDYESVSLFSHQGDTYHNLVNGTGYDYIYNTEIGNADCQALFYNLFCCGASDYMQDGYMTGYYTYTGSGLVTVGTAKSGGMLQPEDFYPALAEGACIGEAFQDWFTVNGELRGNESRAWFYGMNIAGDPTLEIGGYEPAPAAPSELTVEHWGNTYSPFLIQNWYMRSDDVLGLTQSLMSSSYRSGAGGTVYTGFRVWKKDSVGNETEITGGVAAAVVSRSIDGWGMQTATWQCPTTYLATTDMIVVRVYQSVGVNPPTGLAATFTSPAFNANRLDNVTWTLNYYTIRDPVWQDEFRWGISSYNSRIEGIKRSVLVNPLKDNTLNWTKSADDGGGANDVAGYRIYRAETPLGPWTTLIATVPAGTETYVDLNKGTADAINWWYVVRAFDSAGMEEKNTVAIPETVPSSPSYAIDLAGRAPGSWAFLSFPIGTSGSVESVLNDAAWGDGGTAWDVVKAWDNANKCWLSYRRGGTGNTITQINNKMGFWMHLTSNDGDQALSITPGPLPNSTVQIQLYAGWNMVGYPSDRASNALSTLPTQADMVSVWQSASPYILDYSDKGLVTLQEGKGYWVRTTADCVWSVQYFKAPFMTLTKSAPATADPGQTIMYTIEYSNLGTDWAHNVSIIESYPTGVTFLNANPAPTIGNNIWMFPALAQDSEGIIFINATVNPSETGGPMTNHALVTFEDALGNTMPDVVASATTIRSGQWMILSKDGPATANPGDMITYQISCLNNGTETSGNVTVTDLYPAGTVYVSALPPPTLGNNVWMLGAIPQGATSIITVTLMIEIGASGSLVNTAYLDYATERVWANHSIQIIRPHIDILWAEDNITSSSGESVIYFLLFSNTGTDAAENVVLTCVYPAGTTYEWASPPPTSGNNVWSFGSIQAHFGQMVYFLLFIEDDAPSSFVVTAYIDYGYERVWANCTTYLLYPDIVFTKEGPEEAGPGEEITYTLTYENVGNDMASYIEIVEYYPPEVTFLYSVPAPDYEDYYWDLGSLAPGGSGTIEITVLVSGDIVDCTELYNEAELYYEGSYGGYFCETAYAYTYVEVYPQITFTMEAPATAFPGDEITYTLTYENIGDGMAYDILIIDYYPSEVTFLCSVPEPDYGFDFLWHIDSLAPGESGTITITVLLDDPLADGTEVYNDAELYYTDSVYDEMWEWASAITVIQGP